MHECLSYILSNEENVSLNTYICSMPLFEPSEQYLLELDSYREPFREIFHSLETFFKKVTFDRLNYFFQIKNLPDSAYSCSELISYLFASLFGSVVPEYDGGVLIKKIKLEAALENKIGRPSARDSRKFLLHTDLSYIENPPSHFLFHCISSDTFAGGQSILVDFDTVLKELSDSSLEELMRPQYSFPVPYYCEGIGDSVTNSVIYKKDGNFYIRYRRDGIKSSNRKAIIALSELDYHLNKSTRLLSIDPNSIVVFDNRRCLHGRTGFIEKIGSNRDMTQVYFSV